MSSRGSESCLFLEIVVSNDVLEGTPAFSLSECESALGGYVKNNHWVDIQKDFFRNGSNLFCRQIVIDGGEALAIVESIGTKRGDRTWNVDGYQFGASHESCLTNPRDRIGGAVESDGVRNDDFSFIFVDYILWLRTSEGHFHCFASFSEVEIDWSAIVVCFEIMSGNRC